MKRLPSNNKKIDVNVWTTTAIFSSYTIKLAKSIGCLHLYGNLITSFHNVFRELLFNMYTG